MRRYAYILTLALAVMMTAACSNDDDELAVQTGEEVTLSLPIEVMLSQPLAEGTRAAIGDPGVDDRLQPPTHLYVFSWIVKPDGTYAAQYIYKPNIPATDWQIVETDNSYCYRLTKDIQLKYSSVDIEDYKTSGQSIGRTYVVALNANDAAGNTSRRTLNDAQIASIMDITVTSPATHPDDPANTDATVAANALRNKVVDFTGWTSDELRDLYSNPIGDTKTDSRGAKNGEILVNITDGKHEMVMGNIRLYHVAAKYDFTWEVDKASQPTVAVNTITVNQLPVKCKIFQPTDNPETVRTESGTTDIQTGTVAIAPTNVGNQWLGREVVYGLQRQDAALHYTVTFKDMDGDGAGTAKGDVFGTFTPATPDAVFTGWYRVIATVN